MKKCIECGSTHKNRNEFGSLEDRCFNCKITVDMLNAFVMAQNNYMPLNGRPRKLTILKYKLEKI